MHQARFTTPVGAAGYTAAELLVTLAVIAIVTAMAAPGLRGFLQNNRAATDANALVSALSLARNEAVTRGTTVSVCATRDGLSCEAGGGWSSGWLVHTDANAPLGSIDGGAPPDTVLRAFPALPAGSVLSAGSPFLSWGGEGFLRSGATVRFTLRVAGCTGNQDRQIDVNLQGRPAVTPIPCP